jgi:hypothetical protein
VNRGSTDFQTLRHRAIGDPFGKPLPQNFIQRFGNLRRASRRFPTSQAFQPARLVSSLPATLGSYRVAKTFRNFLLCGQVTNAKLNRYIAKSKRVGESEAKQRLMPMKHDTHTSLIHETESSVDRGSSSIITVVEDLIFIE